MDISLWQDMMPDTVTVEPFSSINEYGAVTYGTSVTYKARVQGRVRMITDFKGEQKLSQVTAYIAGYSGSPQDRITLPSRFSPTQPSILSVQPVLDERGVHHTVVFA